MSHEFKHPIIGQEAVTRYGLGRVVKWKDKFPEQSITVKDYVGGVEHAFSPHNVRLVKIVFEDEA